MYYTMKIKSGLGVALFFCLPLSCLADKKIIIEIVSTRETFTATGGRQPGTPEKKETHCKTSETGDSKTEDCTTITAPAEPATTSPTIITTSYDAKIIWPNGSHIVIRCSQEAFLDSDGCGPIDSFHPEDTKKSVEGSVTTLTGLGKFEAKRGKGDELIIYTATGKRKYHMTDNW
jgi:hypothetical protein